MLQRNDASTAAWVKRYAPRANPARRVFCFPYAGAGASLFRPLALSFPSSIEVCAIEYPGRASRTGEPFGRSVEELAAGAAAAIAPLLSVPFAVIGYSLGALVAFEWLSRIGEGEVSPARFFVWSCAAPHVPLRHPGLRDGPDEAFVKEVQARYGGIPEVVLANRELLELVLPVLRADLSLYERYRAEKGRDAAPRTPALRCGVDAFAGSRDLTLPREDAEGWRFHTRGGLVLETLEADHFVHSAHASRLQSAVVRRMLS